MMETPKPKPLWWKTRNGKVWHENHSAERSDALAAVIAGELWGWPICGFQTHSAFAAFIRRTAPPVADQCKRCRAAKAKAKKESGK